MGGTVGTSMRTTPAGNDHGGSLFPHPISIRIKEFSCGIRKAVQILDEGFKGIDLNFPVPSISYPIHIHPRSFPLLNLLEKKGKTNLTLTQNDIIDEGTF
jgi:hypothetical protein